jgi:hypothetical protein
MKLPLADAPSFRGAARRTSAIRLSLAVSLVGCLVAALALSSGSKPASADAAPRGQNVEVVLDVSGSVADISNPQILGALRQIAANAKRIGLVAFSDSAEEVLPPETPAGELRKLFRFFEPIGPHRYAPNPWSLRFTGGTTISAGLALAREALQRDDVRGPVVLVSDAADSVVDSRKLRRELVALARADLSFRLIRLRGSTAGDVAVYRHVFGKGAVREVSAPTPSARVPHSRRFPVALATLVVLAAVLLAIRELVAVSLRWRVA